MYRLLAINEFQALYEHRTDRPDQPIEPFAYLNDLLSIRSAAGFISFLKNHPQGLNELERSIAVDKEIETVHFRFPWGERFDFSEKVIMNAATGAGIDYLDAATDISGHYDELSAIQELSDRTHAFADKYGSEISNPELLEKYKALLDDAPEPDLYRMQFESLGYLVDRIEALLLLAASARGVGDVRQKFVYRKERCFPFQDREYPLVAFPYEAVLEVLPQGMMPGHMEDKLRNAKYLALQPVPQNWEEIDFSDDSRRFDEMGLEVKLIAIYDDPEEAITFAINDVVAFALTEWIAHFSSLQGVSNSYMTGLTMRSSKLNDIVLELANIIVEKRVGVCPVCGRPFVVKRKPGKSGRLNKKYCTDSCKVRDNAGSRKKGGGESPSA